MGYHGSHFGRARKLVTFASYDFERWTRASCLGFRRDDIPPRQTAPAPNMAAEVHRGAGLWDRGNVIIGIYDMVHGSRTGDPAEISMDLGLIVSNDALHYREPMPDFRLVPACGEPEVTLGRGPFIKRAQAICHVGDQTMCWYEAWHDGDIRLATWQRDRLGCFAVFREVPVAEDEYFPIARPQPHFISCPIPLQEGGSRLFINADGLSEHGPLKVEILDEQFRTLPGYAGDDCLPITESGLRQPVGWRGRETIEESDCRVRVKVIWGGLRPEDARLYAVYVG
jgi:hypothetical protein